MRICSLFRVEIYVVAFLLLCNFNSKAQQSRPNIIYILVDDLGYGDLGILFQNNRAENLPALRSPHLDVMAKSGAILTQHYANAPVCAPSRASLLTGVNQGNASVRDNQFDKALENNHTIATVLKTAGYETVAIGKWGLQGDEDKMHNWPAHPLKRGFDNYFGYMRHADGHEHYPVEGIYRGKKQIWSNYKEVSEGYEKCYTTDLWTAKAKDYIINFEKQHKNQKPFLMYLAYDAPHAVLELPTQKYPDGGGLHGGMQWIGTKGKMINTASGIVDSYVHPDYEHATYDNDNNQQTPNVPWPDTYKRYATAVRRLDDAVGDLRKLLVDLKIDSNTLVVFTSDNGPSIESYLPASYVPNHPTFFGSYGPFDGVKRDCWEGGLRMPAIVTWPKNIVAGRIIETPSMLSDWLTTFADVANLTAPARCTGVSLLPVLKNKGKQQESTVYAEYFEGGITPNFPQFESDRRARKRNQMQMIRFGNYVGVRYDVKSANDKFEIYDVINDPKEINNLADNPGFDKLQIEMQAKVLQMRISDKEAPRPYDEVLIPSVSFTNTAFKGFKWSYFSKDFSYVSALPVIKPTKIGIDKNLGAINTLPKGMIVYKAFIKILKDGNYSFRVSTKSNAFIKLHDMNLLDADFDYKKGTLVERNVFLAKGYHPISIYCLIEHKGEQNFQFQFKSADGIWTDINAANCDYIKEN